MTWEPQVYETEHGCYPQKTVVQGPSLPQVSQVKFNQVI